MSQNSSTENLAEKRGSSKGRGRVLKVLGDIHLLCGLLPAAITSYTQSVEILRLTTDYIWHASALEGVTMALVLLRFLNIEFSVRPLPCMSLIPTTDPCYFAASGLIRFSAGRAREISESTRSLAEQRHHHRPFRLTVSYGCSAGYASPHTPPTSTLLGIIIS